MERAKESYFIQLVEIKLKRQRGSLAGSQNEHCRVESDTTQITAWRMRLSIKSND